MKKSHKVSKSVFLEKAGDLLDIEKSTKDGKTHVRREYVNGHSVEVDGRIIGYFLDNL